MKDPQENQSADSHDLLMKYLKHPELLKEKIQDFVETEREVLGESFQEIADLSEYVLKNWRILAPPLVAFALSFLLKETEGTVKESEKRDSTAGTLLN